MAKTSAYQQAKKLQKRNKSFGNLIVEGQKEPDYAAINPDSPSYQTHISHALNFANVAFDNATFKQFAADYSESDKEGSSKPFSRIPEHQFRSLGTLSWLAMNEVNLSDSHKQKIVEERKRLSEYNDKSEDAKETSESSAPRKSIQDFVKDKAAEFASKLEEFIDVKSYGADVYKWLAKEEVKPSHVPYILQHFSPWVEEINLYNKIKRKANKTDSELQLVEAYQESDKKQMDFILKLAKDLETYASAQKQQRKPRKKKAKSVEKTVSKVNYCKQDTDFKVSSIVPENIVGSETLWVFNVKTRQLGVYHAQKDSGGLQVKGTTISNYVESASVAKTLRKPEEHLQKVVSGSKIYLRKVLEGINSKPKPLNGRINSDTILLRVT